MNSVKIKKELNRIVLGSSCYNEVAAKFLQFMAAELKIDHNSCDPQENEKMKHAQETNVLYQTGIKNVFILY